MSSILRPADKKGVYSFWFSLEAKLPTMNEIIALAGKTTRYRRSSMYSKVKRHWTSYICDRIGDAKKLPSKNRYGLRFVWTVPSRHWDSDNVSAGEKFVLDGIAKAKKIANDNLMNIVHLEHDYEIGKVRKVELYYCIY